MLRNLSPVSPSITSPSLPANAEFTVEAEVNQTDESNATTRRLSNPDASIVWIDGDVDDITVAQEVLLVEVELPNVSKN